MFKPLSCNFDISGNHVVSRLTTLGIKVLNTAVKNRLNNSMIALLLEMRFVSPKNSTKYIGFFGLIDSYVYSVH